MYFWTKNARCYYFIAELICCSLVIAGTSTDRVRNQQDPTQQSLPEDHQTQASRRGYIVVIHNLPTGTAHQLYISSKSQSDMDMLLVFDGKYSLH